MPSRPKSRGTVVVGETPKVGDLEGRGGGVGWNALRALRVCRCGRSQCPTGRTWPLRYLKW